MITQGRLKELFHYDEAAGSFTWKATGRIAGGKASNGWTIRIDGRLYKRARLVWLWNYGEHPQHYVRRKNNNIFDDRIGNLSRPVGNTRMGSSEGREADDNWLSYVREMIEYRQEDGTFFWRVSLAKVKAGSPAGTWSSNGYLVLNVGGRRVMAHRVGIYLSTGVWPHAVVDHVDGNPRNNRIGNLRFASRAQNSANISAVRSNTGFKGVYYDTSRRKYEAKIRRNGKTINLGRYGSLDDAVSARRSAAERFDGLFVNHGQPARCATE